MTKKIDVIVKYFIPVVAGIEVNVLETYSRLVKKGWDVTVHTSKDTYLRKNWLSESESIRGLKVRRYPFKWYGFWPRINWQEAGVIALHNFDIFPHLQLLAFFVWKKIFNRKTFKVFLTPHGGYNPEWAIFSPLQKLIKKNYHETLGKSLINFAVDGVRAVSDWEKGELIKSGIVAKKVRTISNGLEDEAFVDVDRKASEKIKKIAKSYGRYIFGNARIYEIKNQETIIRALPLIPKDIKFVNIGTIGSTVGNQTSTGEYLQKLKKLATELGVADRLIFPGVVQGVDKYYLFKHAVCFVYMAIWESFCNVVHEAISQGQVCIVANNTALPYLVKDKVNGYLVGTHDHQALAQKINYILANFNSAEIKAIRSRNMTEGRKNSWENVANQVNKFYQV